MGLRGPLPRRAMMPAAVPSDPLPPPSWLPSAAVEVWHEIEPRLRAADRLRPEHADTLAAWACTAAELRALSAEIATEGSTAVGPHGEHPSAAHSAAVRLRGSLVTLGRCLGLDPASSARLDAMGPPADDVGDSVPEPKESRDRRRQEDNTDDVPAGGSGYAVLDYMRRHRGSA